MRARIAGSFALLFFAVAGAHAQQASRLQLGAPVRATLPGDGTLRYELTLPKQHFVAGRVDQDSVDATVTITAPGRHTRAARGARRTRRTRDVRLRHRHGRQIPDRGHAGDRRQRRRRTRAANAIRAGRDHGTKGKVDQAAAQLYKDTPGAVVGVIKGGKLTFVKGYGSANLTYGMPFTAETPTNIGSSSKQFTGFALALLASRGKLSLDDDVRKYIPELKDFGKKITVRHLLSHTTGYREFVNTLLIEGRQVLEGDYIAPDEVIKVINRQPTLQNEPGAEFNYNNSAFSLATIVLERVTGRPFAEWMRDGGVPPARHDADVGARGSGSDRSWPIDRLHRRRGRLPRSARSPRVAGRGRHQHDAGRRRQVVRAISRPGSWADRHVIKEMTTSFVLNNGKPSNYGYGHVPRHEPRAPAMAARRQRCRAQLHARLLPRPRRRVRRVQQLPGRPGRHRQRGRGRLLWSTR